MSINELTERVHSLGNAWEHFKQVNDDRLQEIERKGYADPLYGEHLKKISDALDQHKRRMDQIETVHARPGLEMSAPSAVENQTEYKQAFRNYLRKGSEAAFDALQVKALSVGTDASGGYLVPNQLADTIASIVRESSPMRQLAQVESISSDSLDLIEDADEMAASWADETTVRSSDTATASIGRNTIDRFEMFAQPKATQKLIDDAAINIEQWIAEKVAEKFARLEATSFIGGNGTSQPKGILSYTAGTSWGQVQQLTSGVDGAVTADSLI